VRPFVWLLFFVCAGISQAAPAPDAVFAPLRLYEGTWRITSNGQTEQLKNQCALLGRYFACSQVINGQQGALLVFIPTATTGQFHTQNISPDGRASGLADLQISGDHWIFSSRWDQGGGKTTFYRTTNVFTGKNRVHFEQAESTNGKDWAVKKSGDEVRLSGAAR